MNWFEGDDGYWWNLDQINLISPRQGDESPEVLFAGDCDGFSLTDAEWDRLQIQLRNSQRPCDRRQEPAAPATAETGTPDEAKP
jgi:hypothetical protein